MKLELKHLAAYLPHKLECKDLADETNFTLDVLNVDGALNDATYLNTIRLYLRPLSDLTKEIEHNGEKFVPLFELLKMATDEKDYRENCFNSRILHDFNVLNGLGAEAFYEDCRFVFRYYKDNMTFSFFNPQGIIHNCGFKYMQKLFEWHFDIYGLIEKGLAIEKKITK